MDLFTEAQYAQLLNNGSPENRDQDHAPVVQLTIPGTACCWLLSEIEPKEPGEPEAPNIAFGLCDLGLGFPELGYVDLDELKAIKVGPFGFSAYNNHLFQGKFPMSVYAAAARHYEYIVWDEAILARFSNPKPPQPKP